MRIESVSGAIGVLSLICAAMCAALPAVAGGTGSGSATGTGTGQAAPAAKAAQVVFYGAGRVKNRDEQSYAWVKDHGTSMVISGNGESIPVDELKRALPGDFIWFRDGERTFVIVDPALLARVAAFWAPYDTISDSVTASHAELRKQEKALAQMPRGAKAGDAAPQDASTRAADTNAEAPWQSQKALVARLRAAHEALLQSRSAAFKQCQAAARALFDQAIRDGKASPWPLA